MAKKFLSLILTLSMVASLFAGMTFNVSAATVSATETTENVVVDHYFSRANVSASDGAGAMTTLDTSIKATGSELVTDSDITANDVAIYNYERKADGTVTQTRYDADTFHVGTMTNALIFDAKDCGNSILYDFKYTKEDEVEYREMTKYGRDSEGYYTLYEKRKKTDNYMTADPEAERVTTRQEGGNGDDDFQRKTALEYRLGTNTVISDVIIGQSGVDTRTGYYTLLTSNNGVDWTKQYAYAADRKVDGAHVVNSGIQHIKLATPVKAAYVRIEYYDLLNTTRDSAGWEQFKYAGSSLRIRAFAVYGQKGVNYTYDNYGTNGNNASEFTAASLKTKYDSVIGVKNSLIREKKYHTGSRLYYFISSKDLDKTAIPADANGITFDKVTQSNDQNFGALVDGNYTTDATLAGNSTLKNKMFVRKDVTGNVSEDDYIDDESRQWLQINFALDAEAEIDQFMLLGKNSNLAWNMSHYKYFLSDTLEGLFDDANCYAEVKNAARLSTVTFNEPVKAKYVGIRVICALGGKGTDTGFPLNTNIYNRSFEFEVFGDYVNQMPDGVTPTATAEGANTTPTASEITYSGNPDTSGKYSKASLTLSAETSVTEENKTYMFDGWYLGEDKVAAASATTYNLTGKEANLDFTAKYVLREYTIVGSTDRNDYVNYYDPAKNLIETYDPEVYYYNNTDFLGEAYKTTEPRKTKTHNSNRVNSTFVDQYGNPLDLKTWQSEKYFAAADMQFFEDATIKQNLFIDYGENVTSDSKPVAIIDDETKQWAQFNYTLTAPAKISTVALSNLRDFATATSSAWNVRHYKVILSDTKEGLLDTTKATKVIEVADNQLAISAVVLAEPIVAKYVGIRFICAYNSANNAIFNNYKKSVFYPRLSRIDIVGEYAEPIEEKTVTATLEGADETATATAEFKFFGADDASGNCGFANVTLTTNGTYTVDTKIYNFLGWYLGDELVSTNANYTYAVKADDAKELKFVAKYEAATYVLSGYNNRNEFKTDNLKRNLLANVKLDSVFVLNTETYEDAKLGYLTKNEPTELTTQNYSEHTNKLTSASVDMNNADTAILVGDWAKNFFVNPNSDGKGVGDLTEDETKQWVQVNYALPGEATINEFVVSAFKSADDSLSRWTPKHYKVIFANSKEDLVSGENATVYEIDHTANTIKNITTATLTETVTAKYVAIRFIQPYNDFATPKLSHSFDYSNGLYLRLSHFDVYGTFTAPATEDVTAKAVDAEGADVAITATVAATGVGGKDDNGKYAKYSVALSAEETKVIGDYEYTFAGWYKNDEANAVLATATGNVTVADADAVQFTAKYTSKKLITNYTLTFLDASKTVVGTIVIEEGQEVDMALVNAIEVKDIYGYEVFRDEEGNVVWDKGFDEAITADATYTALYKAKDISTAITLYNLDSKTEYYDHHTQQYDTAITLSCKGAKSWVDENGNVLLDTAEGVLYACGSRMKLYPVSEQKTAPAVAVVGKVNDGNYSVFAHVNVENATEYGVVFSSSTGYSMKNDFTVEDAKADADSKRYKMVEIDATQVGQIDFVATLEGTGDKTRYARAYVKVGDDYIYTDAIRNK